MNLFQNINKKSLSIAATVVAVLVGGVGVSYALSALPDSKNDSPTTTVVVAPAHDVMNPSDSTEVPTVAPTVVPTVATLSSSTTAGGTTTTTSVGAPPAASIGGSVGGGGDDDEDGEHEGGDNGDDD